VDFPTILVSASPRCEFDTTSSVATPLEKQFSTIAGIDSMTSTSSGPTSPFSSTSAAASTVPRSMCRRDHRRRGQLPPEMPTPPTFQKVNPATFPILYLALSSPTMKLSDVDEAAETTIAQNIWRSTAAQAQVYEPRSTPCAQLDPSAGLRQSGSTMSAPRCNQEHQSPTGTLYGQNHTFTILSTGQRANALQFGNGDCYRNGSPVRLNELGRVIDSVVNDKTASWFNGFAPSKLAIQSSPAPTRLRWSTTSEVAAPARDHIPAAVRIDTLYDRSVSIRASVNDVKFTLFDHRAGHHGDLRLPAQPSATIIPGALPMSIIGTFSVMYCSATVSTTCR
jgi:HAE1 family hydrophobic/amphiphilic exporter-1